MYDKNGHTIRRGDAVIASSGFGRKWAGLVIAINEITGSVLIRITGLGFSRYFRASQVAVQLISE